MTWYKWSVTAASNATADSTINWAEGQAPSSVNDSARGMMAAAAKYRKDLGGVTTGGSSTAYTITSNQVFDLLANMSGNIVTIIPHTTSGASPTLNVDGLGAKALNVSTTVAIPTGALVTGSPYSFVYVNASNEFILINSTAVLQTISATTASGDMVASQAVMETGTSTSTLTSPGRQHFNPRHPKAWANFSGEGTPAVTVGTGVSSITDNGAGDYAVNWTTSFSTANYCTVGNGGTPASGASMILAFDRSTAAAQVAPTASSVRLNIANFGTGVLTDTNRVYIAAFGDFA